MICPVCDHRALIEGKLKRGPVAQLCQECGGSWITAIDYRNWQENQDGKAKKKGRKSKPVFEDIKVAKKCPDDASILSRYRISADLDVWLDQCQTCRGIWFDKGEWKLLADKDLHLKLNKYFTEVWQRDIQEEEGRRRREERYEERWGKGNYKRIKRMHQWLLEHPERDAIISYLKAKDPFSDE